MAKNNLNISIHKKAKKVNILFFEPSTGYGGSSRCLLQWLKHLDKEKFNPLVVTYFDGPVIERIKQIGIEVIRVPYISLLKKMILTYKGGEIISYILFLIDMLINVIPVSIRLGILIKKKDIDLIHLNSSINTSIPGILAARLTGIPCVCHIHDTRELNKKEKILARWIDECIVLTNKALQLYKTALGKISVVYNGIDIHDYRLTNDIDQIKQEFNVNKHTPVVGIVGRLTKGKGHVDFIMAAKKIHEIRPEVKFLIVGGTVFTDQETEYQLKALAEDLSLSDCVVFTGWREDIKRVMSIFDVLVFPSSTFPEGFPVTCIEAMALCKPVVATNIPGPSEIVLDGVTGFLVPPSNPNILAEKITTLLDDPQLAENMGLAGRKRVEELFNIKEITQQIEDIYAKLLYEKKEYSYV